MKRFLLVLLLTVVPVAFCHADLTKSVQAGVVTIQGNLGSDQVFIKKYKQAGVCYTNGTWNGSDFSMAVSVQAGTLSVSGSVPEPVAQILSGFGYKVYKCSLFGIVD